MIKKIKPVITFLLFVFLLQSAQGQDDHTMTEFLSRKLSDYCKSVPREEVFVHSDRQEYIAGEDMWFEIYLVDRQSLAPSPESRIVYFEILNYNNKPVVQKKILMNNGFGQGQALLSDTLSTGTYTLRAYTNWMKNFLPVNCFTGDITIYNAINHKNFKDKVVKPVASTEVNDTALSRRYSDSGITLKTDRQNSGNLEITVQAGNKFPVNNTDLLYVVIQTHGHLDFIASGKLTAGQVQLSVPGNKLSKGINQLTIFDSNGKPVYEKYIYTPYEDVSNIISVATSDTNKVRSEVSVEVDMGPAGLNPANLSISVAPVSGKEGGTNIGDYLLFGTEFGNLPWQRSFKNNFQKLDPHVIDSLLAGVKSNWIDWDTVLSGRKPEFKYAMEKEEHFITGKLLFDEKWPAPANEFLLLSTPGKTATFQYGRTDYDGNFTLSIPIDENFKELIIQPDNTADNYRVVLDSPFSDSYPGTQMDIRTNDGSVPDYIEKWGVNYQVSKIYGSGSRGITSNQVTPAPPKRFYGKPDLQIEMKNFIKLPVMEEVFFELIPRVNLKKVKSGYELSITDAFGNVIYGVTPVMMIDGVIINDPGIIAKMDPDLVEKIDVIRDTYVVGDYFFYGLVNVITRAGDFGGVTLPSYAVRLRYRVIDPVASFISPDYTSPGIKASRIPDFRNTLYWNPSMRPGNDGKAKFVFWTSDVTSSYEININGIARDGKTFSIKKTITVK